MVGITVVNVRAVSVAWCQGEGCAECGRARAVNVRTVWAGPRAVGRVGAGSEGFIVNLTAIGGVMDMADTRGVVRVVRGIHREPDGCGRG